MQEAEKEKRRYFKIEDEMILSCQLLETPEKAKLLEKFERGQVDYPDATGLFLSMESDLYDLVQNLSPRQPEIATAIRLLNRKINLVAKGAPVTGVKQTLLDKDPELVNISACGVVFSSKELMNLGQDVQIELVLLPEEIYILSYGVVVGCEKGTLPLGKSTVASTHPYCVSVDFMVIRQEDTERLIQHIMRREMEMLKARRRRKEEND